MPLKKIEAPTRFENLRWFGITRGNEAFAAKANSYQEAADRLADGLGVSLRDWAERKPIVIHLRGEPQEIALDNKYAHTGRRVLRLVPGTLEEVPLDHQALSMADHLVLESALKQSRQPEQLLGRLLLSTQADEHFGGVLMRIPKMASDNNCPALPRVRDLLVKG